MSSVSLEKGFASSYGWLRHFKEFHAMTLVPEIIDGNDLKSRLAQAIGDVRKMSSQFPDRIWLASILKQLEFVQAHIESGRMIGEGDKQRLNFGLLVSKEMSGGDDRLEDEIHAISSYLRKIGAIK